LTEKSPTELTAVRLKFGPAAIVRGAAEVTRGGLIAFPTDTVYGLGCDPMNEAAVLRLFRAKMREAKPIPLLCSDLDAALAMARLSPPAEALARRHWPGPLTIVAPAIRPLPRLIHQGSGEVGVRVPALAGCRELAKKAGGYVTGTSANISGRPPCTTADEVEAELEGSLDMILDGGRRAGLPSTVVRVAGKRIEVLREGPVRVPEESGP
jgi:L-threonylcarbamoyladenylate synthase